MSEDGYPTPPQPPPQPAHAPAATGGRFCPGCGYALRGLPPTGTCPECGAAYAPGTVWLQREQPSIMRMVGLIGIPLWAGLLVIVASMAPMGGGAGILMVGAYLAALAWLIATPMLMRGYARKYLPPGDRRWGMIRNAARLSPALLIVLLLSYTVSILAGTGVVALGIAFAICAMNPGP